MGLPVSFVEDQWKDYGGETARTKIAVTTLTAANYVAQKILIDAMITAIGDLVLGLHTEDTVIIDREQLASGFASSNLAQRENKWLVRYHDGTNSKKYRVEIPTAKLSLLAANSEFLDLTAGVGLAFKSAFEAIAKSPYDATHTVVVDSVQFVGREA
jgi:hypothetical protein